MKLVLSMLLFFVSFTGYAQYYFKDIMGVKESNNLIAAYRENKVQSVTMKSYTINNTPLENLVVQQFFDPNKNTLLTITKTDYLPPSYLTTFFDEEGKTIRTKDSANSNVTTTEYRYTNGGKIQSILTKYSDQLSALQTDEHLWHYDANETVAKMLRIKNGQDTSVVAFVVDGAGNVIEERETRRFIKEEPIYYYYDAKNRLTDIVRFNKKAARLLPEQMFDYSVKNHVIQRTTIPQNSSEYLLWRYRYNDRGLKVREDIFNKEKELTGRVEYSYTYNEQ